jgi:hypothetical protein
VTEFFRELFSEISEDLSSSTIGRVHTELNDSPEVGSVVLFLFGSTIPFVDESHEEFRVAVVVVENAD